MNPLGVHSEVGKLRTVMVCRPGLAHQRVKSRQIQDRRVQAAAEAVNVSIPWR